MATNLELIAKSIAESRVLATGESAKNIYAILSGIVAEMQSASTQPSNDQLTNLKIENANLKAQLGAMSQMGEIVEATRTSLRQREDASEVNKPAVRLPIFASEIIAELDKRRLFAPSSSEKAKG